MANARAEQVGSGCRFTKKTAARALLRVDTHIAQATLSCDLDPIWRFVVIGRLEGLVSDQPESRMDDHLAHPADGVNLGCDAAWYQDSHISGTALGFDGVATRSAAADLEGHIAPTGCDDDAEVRSLLGHGDLHVASATLRRNA